MLLEVPKKSLLPDKIFDIAIYLALSPVEIRRLEHILNSEIKYQKSDLFSNSAWVRNIMEAQVNIEPGRPPSHSQHEIMFAKLHYFRHIIANIRDKVLTSNKIKRQWILALLFWDKQQLELRDRITTSNMGLVLNMAQHCKYANVEYGELISEGSMALLRVTECYDYRLGFQFSTYACRAIGKSFSRLAKKTYKYNHISQLNFDPTLEVDTTCQQLRQQRLSDSILQLRHYILGQRPELSEIEKEILRLRFSVGQYKGNPMTLKDIGSTLGLSKERIRQIQNQAVLKLGKIVRE
ncbi:MAG: sigma-70 family RNA polymerase sigma factor [Sedimentisphaerales bacterium]|nr:sigma-70 family RNA polymerase sigma factor [Sedimentisphaerales bacterium]